MIFHHNNDFHIDDDPKLAELGSAQPQLVVTPGPSCLTQLNSTQLHLVSWGPRFHPPMKTLKLMNESCKAKPLNLEPWQTPNVDFDFISQLFLSQLTNDNSGVAKLSPSLLSILISISIPKTLVQFQSITMKSAPMQEAINLNVQKAKLAVVGTQVD